jgi:hypothetical protein
LSTLGLDNSHKRRKFSLKKQTGLMVNACNPNTLAMQESASKKERKENVYIHYYFKIKILNAYKKLYSH